MKIVKLAMVLFIALMCQGCMADDVEDLKQIAEINMYENNRLMYQTGMVNGFIFLGMRTDEAVTLSERLTDEAFGVEADE
jgi:hypothetical protein